ncbi:unnamed protein product, partial [Mesorhabditis spiculigera]
MAATRRAYPAPYRDAAGRRTLSAVRRSTSTVLKSFPIRIELARVPSAVVQGTTPARIPPADDSLSTAAASRVLTNNSAAFPSALPAATKSNPTSPGGVWTGSLLTPPGPPRGQEPIRRRACPRGGADRKSPSTNRIRSRARAADQREVDGDCPRVVARSHRNYGD